MEVNMFDLRLKALIIFVILFCSTLLYAQAVKVAVTDFDGEKHYKDYASTVTGIIISELSADSKIELIERSQLKKILDEHGLQMTGLVNPEQAVEIGKFIAINKLIAGTIGPLGNQFVITVRMIDIETAKIDLSVTETVPNASSLPSGSKVVAEKLLNAIKSGKAVSESAREKLKYSCETKKDASACFKLGVSWYKGTEGMKNLIFARKLFGVSCRLGFGKACYYSGNMAKKGIGGNKEPLKAGKFFKAACDSGFQKGCTQKGFSSGGGAFGAPATGGGNESIGPKKKPTGGSEETITELEE
jgi:hypothetical protein